MISICNNFGQFLLAPIEEEDQVDAGCRNESQRDSNEWSEENPGNRNYKTAHGSANNERENNRSKGHKAAKEPPNKRNPVEKLDYWLEKEIDSQNVQEDAKRTEYRVRCLHRFGLGVEEVLRGLFGVGDMIDGFLEHDPKEQVYQDTGVAANERSPS